MIHNMNSEYDFNLLYEKNTVINMCNRSFPCSQVFLSV